MLFNSFRFLLGFLPIALLGFYGLDALGRRLARRPNARLLACGIAFDLAYLAAFKYADFAVATADALFGLALPLPGVRLPIGVSFFTFTQIAYLVDCHRRLARDAEPAHYALFVTFFPHLVAGPLIHHRAVMPQFDDARTYRFDTARLGYGLTYFALGLFKKTVLADPLGAVSDRLFAAAAAGPVTAADAWAGALAYALQLYFDFSGYSDMAIGLGLLFGVRLPIDFDSPYKAGSIVDFWRRWHVTLSAFLRDYLYVPLGGNRRGPARRDANLVATMVLGGLWHGASWSFVLWGAIHGTGLTAAHLWRGRGPRLPAAAAFAAELLPAAGVRPGCVIVTQVPEPFLDYSPLVDAVAEATGAVAVLPRVPDLATFDGSHLDRASGDRWAEAFFAEAGPAIDRCLAAPAGAAS